MKIVILGAGQVGSTLAENFYHEENDVTIVDIDSGRLKKLEERIDLRTICGHASYPCILHSAGTDDADILIAVTNSDEVNMVACQVAETLFHTPTKIARIRQASYLKHRKLFGTNFFAIDVSICPEQVVTEYIRRLIARPGALQVVDFADGLVQLVAVRVASDSPLLGHKLALLKEDTRVELLVMAVYRHDNAIIPAPDTIVMEGDEIFFIVETEKTDDVLNAFRKGEYKYHQIMIAGGGNVGMNLARELESDHNIKVVDHNKYRCELLSHNLEHALILHGNVSDKELLLSENIAKTDLFCALTNDDEANIMSAMLAKRLGAGKVMAIINNPAYIDLIEGSGIDIAVSPQFVTTGALLRYVRRGDVVTVHQLRRGAAEAIEVVIHGDQASSKVIGRTLQELELPDTISIGAIIRGGEVLMAQAHLTIAAEDHLLVFIVDSEDIKYLEKLLQVGLTFL